MDKLLANKINMQLMDKDIISVTAKETKLILDDYYMSTNGFDMSWAVISGLVLRLGVNNMNYEPISMMKTLIVRNGSSYLKFYNLNKKLYILICMTSWLS